LAHTSSMRGHIVYYECPVGTSRHWILDNAIFFSSLCFPCNIIKDFDSLSIF
jgi:hypothetical protein